MVPARISESSHSVISRPSLLGRSSFYLVFTHANTKYRTTIVLPDTPQYRKVLFRITKLLQERNEKIKEKKICNRLSRTLLGEMVRNKIFFSKVFLP
jgi:hypothetical protein